MSEALPDIRGHLAADATLVSLLANLGTSPVIPAIYPGGVLAEGSALPALTYQVISLVEEHNLLGPSCGLSIMRVQIDCYAKSYAEVDAVCWAVRALFDGYQGPMGSATINNTQHENVIDEFVPERRQYRRILDFMLLYNDAA